MAVMIPQIKLENIMSFDGTISQEISHLINTFSSNTEAIKGNISQLRDLIEESKQEAIITILKERAKSEKVITDLKNEMLLKN
jgi:hypothetical protein